MADEDRPTVDLNAIVSSLVARVGGDERQALRQVVDENHTLRVQRRKLRSDLAELKQKPQLKDGEIVLTADQAKQWKAYGELKLTPEQVQQAMQKVTELETAETTRTYELALDEGAKGMGFDPKRTRDFLKARELRAEKREVEVEKDGKKQKQVVLVVRPAKDDKATFEQLEDVAKREDYLPVLRAKAGTEDEATEASEEQETQPVEFIEQKPSGKAPARNDPLATYMKSRYDLKPEEILKPTGA